MTSARPPEPLILPFAAVEWVQQYSHLHLPISGSRFPWRLARRRLCQSSVHARRPSGSSLGLVSVPWAAEGGLRGGELGWPCRMHWVMDLPQSFLRLIQVVNSYTYYKWQIDDRKMYRNYKGNLEIYKCIYIYNNLSIKKCHFSNPNTNPSDDKF